MSNLMHQHPSQGWAGDSQWWSDLNVYLNGQDTNGNYSNVTLEITEYSTTSATTQNGVFVGELWQQGNLVANTSSNRNIGTGAQQIAVWSGNIGHDANGNANPYIEYYANMPVTEMSRRGANWSLPRIPLAPNITSITADQITPNSVRLGLEIGGFGHGTGATMHMSYRQQGSGTWITTADQADAAGYNYWTVTGLQPGITYEYTGIAFNNNGDTGTYGTQTFKTQSLTGLTPLLMALL